MTPARADEMSQEIAANELIPEGEPRLVKAIKYVPPYYGMPSFKLEGDGSILYSYSYIVMPLMKKGTVLDLILKVNHSN
jgi:hypothetical protein